MIYYSFTQDYNQKMLTATAFDPEKNLTYKYRTICEEKSKDKERDEKEKKVTRFGDPRRCDDQAD